MPARYVIHEIFRLVISIGEGRVTFSEAMAHDDTLQSDPAFNPEFNHLIDATSVTAYALSGSEIRVVVNRKLFSPSSKRAFVGATTFMYGIGRMLEIYYEMSERASPAAVFRDRRSALKWLGIPEDSGLY